MNNTTSEKLDTTQMKVSETREAQVTATNTTSGRKVTETEHRERIITSSDPKLRKFATWSAVLGTLSLCIYFAIFIIYQTFYPSDPSKNWFIKQLNDHFAATMGVPLSALTAFCIVILLKTTIGEIEIEAKGIKFGGASGPIIFWILCFIIIVTGVYFLWNKTT